MEILRVEQERGTLHGVIVQFGGQTPAETRQRRCTTKASRSWAPRPDAIDLAEDRERFQQLLNDLKPETAGERNCFVRRTSP